MFFKRIEFFILLYFLIRLYGITDPPLEVAHHWRQVTGLMVARNFLEVDNNIFFPRVDENNGGVITLGKREGCGERRIRHCLWALSEAKAQPPSIPPNRSEGIFIPTRAKRGARPKYLNYSH